jgi:hypothetical protein
MFKFRHQNAGQNHNLKTANTTFHNIAKVKYFGTTPTSRNYINGEINRRCKSGNAECLLPLSSQSDVIPLAT